MKGKVSQRGLEMPASPIRRLAGAARAAERRGITVYKLNIGQPDVPHCTWHDQHFGDKVSCSSPGYYSHYVPQAIPEHVFFFF